MKINRFKKIGLALLTGAVLFGGCESTELDLAANPNELSPDQSNPDLFLNSIQVDFANFTELMGWNGGDLVRIGYMNGRNYQNIANFAPAQLDFEWEIAYQGDNRSTINGILADIRAMAPVAVEDDLFHHTAMGQFIEAYTMVTLVDYFGDVPYSEAIQGEGENAILNPVADSGASIYDAALLLLDEAIANFRMEVVNEPLNDFYYNGNWENWIKACNTLKMKIYLQRRLVDANAITEFENIVASGDFIDETSEDFQFQWGSKAVQPDVRHPRYADNYLTDGGADYLPNWLMNYMSLNNDPRIRYYFYRQTNAVPGQEIPPNEETISCSLEPTPQHYIDGGFTFCTLPDGYWGRDHGQNAGIPPDGFLRTIYGVYPSGGKFDDNSFEGLSVGSGGGGAGVTPILLASWVDFMQAEVAMLDNDFETSKTFLLSGVEKSVAKVLTFGALDSGANEEGFRPTGGQIASHLSDIESRFDAATTIDGRFDIIAEEYWVALFGNGTDAYNFYRRTGYPTTLQPNLEPPGQTGGFIRSLQYPAIFVNNNSSVQQKSDQSVQVFWDTNPPSPQFPVAN
ncbi:MAG: SusD/RagB family nutrient-binding outer membrane lipoprotein [Pricia sp.]